MKQKVSRNEGLYILSLNNGLGVIMSVVMACPALWKILSVNKFVADNRKKRCYHSQADSMLPDSSINWSS
jgi:hypothetical protein